VHEPCATFAAMPMLSPSVGWGWMVLPMSTASAPGAATGAFTSACLSCELLIYAHKALKKLDVMKHGHGILERSLVAGNKRFPQN